jgi:hypothetical protein
VDGPTQASKAECFPSTVGVHCARHCTTPRVTDQVVGTVQVLGAHSGAQTHGGVAATGLGARAIAVCEAGPATTIVADQSVTAVPIVGAGLDADLICADPSTKTIHVRSADRRFVAFARAQVTGLVSWAVAISKAVLVRHTVSDLADEPSGAITVTSTRIGAYRIVTDLTAGAVSVVVTDDVPEAMPVLADVA